MEPTKLAPEQALLLLVEEMTDKGSAAGLKPSSIIRFQHVALDLLRQSADVYASTLPEEELGSFRQIVEDFIQLLPATLNFVRQQMEPKIHMVRLLQCLHARLQLETADQAELCCIIRKLHELSCDNQSAWLEHHGDLKCRYATLGASLKTELARIGCLHDAQRRQQDARARLARAARGGAWLCCIAAGCACVLGLAWWGCAPLVAPAMAASKSATLAAAHGAQASHAAAAASKTATSHAAAASAKLARLEHHRQQLQAMYDNSYTAKGFYKWVHAGFPKLGTKLVKANHLVHAAAQTDAAVKATAAVKAGEAAAAAKAAGALAHKALTASQAANAAYHTAEAYTVSACAAGAVATSALAVSGACVVAERSFEEKHSKSSEDTGRLSKLELRYQHIADSISVGERILTNPIQRLMMDVGIDLRSLGHLPGSLDDSTLLHVMRQPSFGRELEDCLERMENLIYSMEELAHGSLSRFTSAIRAPVQQAAPSRSRPWPAKLHNWPVRVTSRLPLHLPDQPAQASGAEAALGDLIASDAAEVLEPLAAGSCQEEQPVETSRENSHGAGCQDAAREVLAFSPSTATFEDTGAGVMPFLMQDEDDHDHAEEAERAQQEASDMEQILEPLMDGLEWQDICSQAEAPDECELLELSPAARAEAGEPEPVLCATRVFSATDCQDDPRECQSYTLEEANGTGDPEEPWIVCRSHLGGS